MRGIGKQGWRWIAGAMLVELVVLTYASAGTLNPVVAKAGMVVAGHPEAARAGAYILEEGGTAMDAAVATGFALGVAEPYGSGIGGKCAIVYYHAGTGRVYFIDGLDAAGEALDVEAFVAAGSAARAEGPVGVGVPGMVAAMELGHSKWGKLSWDTLMQPAIELANRGFTVVPGMEVFIERRRERIASNPECARLYLPGGVVPATGSRLPNPDLAATIERIAGDGRAGFYEGTIAERIVGELQSGGSHLTEKDFNNYEARMAEPLYLDWNGYRIVTGGRPTTGGATALLSLALLEKAAIPVTGNLRDPGNLDRWGRALRHVYPVIQANLADTEDYDHRWADLTEPDALDALATAAFGQSGEMASLTRQGGAGIPDAWTTHFVVADADGNVASVTQSLSHHFGSGVVVPGTGVVLNNSLKNFSFSDPQGVNYVAPGKRPRSTIAPAIVFQSGRPVLAIGLPGGGRIPTTLSAVLLDHLQFEQDIGDAIAVKRFHLLRDWSKDPVSNTFQLETGTDPALAKGLSMLGWDVETVSDTEFFGGITAISISPDGTLSGWADTRRTNAAAGAGECHE